MPFGERKEEEESSKEKIVIRIITFLTKNI
jgi:hypothetical protein